jgi:DNA-binding PadR family transcriptional regulator
MGQHHARFGAHGRGGGRRGGRQRARRGAVVEATLLLLEERPMHGYELITEMTERSAGRWQPSPGTIYPALGRMVEHGLIESEEVDGKRRYALTDRGRARLEQYRDERGADAEAPWDDPGTGQRGDLRGRLAELAGQVRQIGRFGTPEQSRQAGEVLRDATRRLYAILATDPDAADTTDATDASDESASDAAASVEPTED